MILFPKIYNIKRESKGKQVKGQWIQGELVTLSIQADVQPLNETEKQEVANIGQKELGKIKVYTDENLIYSVEGQTNRPDRIIFQNREYEIISLQESNAGIIQNNKYIAELRTGITQ